MTSNLTTSKTKSPIQSLASLSRNALYAPLSIYSKKQQQDTKKNINVELQHINNNVREKTLYNFLEKISVEYHSSTSLLRKDGGNNGGLPLRFKQMENKMSQRALTLISGGCGNTFAKSTSVMVSVDNADEAVNTSSQKKRRRNKDFNLVQGSLSNKKRKKAIINQQKMLSQRNKNDGVEINTKVKHDTKVVLVGLNEMWNKYINALLRQKESRSELQSSLRRQEIAALVSTAELIGAFVVIVSNSTSFTGKTGVVVDITKNTWKVACPVGKTKKESIKNLHAIANDAKWKVLVVPKVSSSLICTISSVADNKNVKDLYIRISNESHNL
jgi:RNase P/RNase MRP subunit p29